MESENINNKNNNNHIYAILIVSVIFLAVGFLLFKWAIFPLFIIALMIYFTFRNPSKTAKFYTRYDNPNSEINDDNTIKNQSEDLTCVNCGSNLDKDAKFCSKCGFQMRLKD